MIGCYPTVISYDEAEKVYYVNFPDLSFCYSDAATLDEAVYNAWDVLNLMLCDYPEKHNGAQPPKSSKPGEVSVKDGEILSWVWYDTEQYKKIIRLLKAEAV